MTKRITNEELLEALTTELEAFSEELKDAIESDDAGSVINTRNEIKAWHGKLKELPFLTGSKPVKFLLKQAAQEVSKAAMWLQANPEPDPRPLETEPKTEPETLPLQQDTTTQQDLNPPTPSDPIQNSQQPITSQEPEPQTPLVETPPNQEEKPAPTTVSARKRKLI